MKGTKKKELWNFARIILSELVRCYNSELTLQFETVYKRCAHVFARDSRRNQKKISHENIRVSNVSV